MQAGFALRADHASLSEHPLAWSQVASFNAVVLSGLGQANADMSLGRPRETIDVLNRYLEAGGGVLVLGAFGQMATTKPPQAAFLNRLASLRCSAKRNGPWKSTTPPTRRSPHPSMFTPALIRSRARPSLRAPSQSHRGNPGLAITEASKFGRPGPGEALEQSPEAP